MGGIAFAAIAMACTYDPHPNDGQQECYGPQKKCPDGYVCQFDRMCWTIGHSPAVSPGTGGIITIGVGGTPSVGSTIGSGGIVGYGGSQITGSVIGYGGVAGHGGVVVASGGGSTGLGGTTTPPNTGTVMTISNHQAQGAMTGYGWVAMGALDSVDDPTCNSPLGPITNGMTCDDTAWSSPTAYCMTGSTRALPTPTSDSDYAQNWGIQLSINATPGNPGGPLGQSFSALTVSMTGSPSTGIRVLVHRISDASGANYCASWSPGTAIPFTSFNTTCWNSLGKYLTPTDVATIDQIGVQVYSDSVPISVKNLCVTGITFAR